MSLGNTYNNNQSTLKTTSDVTVYSNYRMNNAESKIDSTCLAFRYWASNLCVSIYPRKNTGNDEIVFDTDNGITVYLSHTKARILKHELELFLKNPTTYTSVGVPTTQGVITISNGVEYGKNNPVLTIRKVLNTGEVVASFAYEFKTEYYYSIRNYDGKNFDTIYDDYKYIEIEQFITVLDEYVKASTNAIAFTVMNQRRYSVNRIDNKIDAIANSLGVDLTKNSNNNGNQQRSRYNGNTYFNNSNNSSGTNNYSSGVGYNSATIDDLE